MRAPTLPVLLLAACTEVVIAGHSNRPDTDPPDLSDTVVDRDPPVAVCHFDPTPAAPGEKVDLVGENSRDAEGSELINYRWSLVKKPTLSAAELPAGDANLGAFVPDLVGTYVATLVVTDAWGNPSVPCAATLEVQPTEDLYIQVKANRDDQIRPVLVKHDTGWPSNQACKPGACSVSWGGADATPTATEGPALPGVVAVPSPADDVYTLRLMDEKDIANGWTSDTTVDVRVWVKGHEAWSTTVTMKGEGIPGDGWSATPVALATILWPAGTVKAVPPP